MAKSTLPFSLFLLSLYLIALKASARPCKTFFFYTTTTPYYPATNAFPYSQSPNPNFDNFPFPRLHSSSSSSPRFLTVFLTASETDDEFSYIRRAPSFPPFFRTFSIHRRSEEKFVSDGVESDTEGKRSSSDESMLPLGIYSSVSTNSIRDRTKDIMSVVGALLFGVGCGALTAATMFLIWSLFSPHRFEFEVSDDEGDDDEDGAKPKKDWFPPFFEDVDLIKKGIKEAQNDGYVVLPDEDVDSIEKGNAAQKEAA